MTQAETNNTVTKSKAMVWLEYCLLALSLAVIALRATTTEVVATQSANQPIDLNTSVYSLSISAVLIFSFIVWLICSLCSIDFIYRRSAIEIGLFIFIIAAVLAGFAASDKRIAITNFVTSIAPILMAILLIQILDGPSKIKLVLFIVVALGLVNTWQCIEQLLYSNQMLIEQYQQNPEQMLQSFSITPGSFNQFLFEHRLYSKGVRGYFTNSNSIGSFTMLSAFAAIGLFIDRWKNLKTNRLAIVTSGFALVVLVSAIAITKSKGTIAAFSLALVIFFLLLYFGDKLKPYRKTIIVICILLGLAAIGAVTIYGLSHGRLPGGNSMLVRWQYWKASAKMFAEHRLSGVGPGNFGVLYTQYKAPASLETVSDPHCFPLSILTQYGPVGLIGFLAMLLLPLYRAFCSISAKLFSRTNDSTALPKWISLSFLLFISATVLLAWSKFINLPLNASPQVIASVIIMLYVMPVTIIIIGFLFVAIGSSTVKKIDTNILGIAAFCAVIAVLLHNLIDLVIFEPGVYTCFWAMMACLVALDTKKSLVLRPPVPIRIFVTIAALVVGWICCNYALIPVVKSTAKIQQAKHQAAQGQYRQGHELLSSAAKDDALSTEALSFNAKIYLQRYYSQPKKQPQLLYNAEKSLLSAIQRNYADYKNYEMLMDTYSSFTEDSSGKLKTDWLKKAFDVGQLAIARYPGSGRLRFKIAGIAEKMKNNQVAIENYQRAIDIEDSFRRQFNIMYPNRELFSRLGHKRYQHAKDKLTALSSQ